MSLPESAVRRMVGPPVVRDGRQLDPAVQLLLKLEQRIDTLSGEGRGAVARRAAFRRSTAIGMPRARAVHAVQRTIRGPASPIAMRVYRSARAVAEPVAIVYLHGGGWVVGDLDTHDASCRLLARETGAVVVSVDYRRAPEDPHPAGLEDALAAFDWVHDNPRELAIRPGAVAVMGDSAGGNLAAVLCLMARDRGGPMPLAQGLLYPATDLRMLSASIGTFAEGFFLTRADMEWYLEQYVPDLAQRTDPLVSPLLADDLSGLPPAHIWTAGFDPLRDEGRAYADRLADAGVPVRYRCLDDQVHGFFGMGVLPYGMEMAATVCREMGELMTRAA